MVALIALAAHGTVLGGGFIWLDHAHLEEGLAIARDHGWLSLFTGGFAGTGYYRPIMAVSLSIDAWLSGAPWLFHTVSLAWHAAAAVSAVAAAEALGLSRRVAVLAGALFAVHPATSLVAGAIAFRSESMIAVAVLLLVAAHLRGRPVAAALALLLGGLTKETVLVVGPLFVVALELSKPSERRLRVRLLGAEALALAIALGLRLAFAPSWRASFPELSAQQAVGTRLAALGKSAQSILLPIQDTVCDAFPVTSIVSLRAAIGAAVFAALGWLVWRKRVPAALLAIALLPSLQLVPVMRWWSPHYLYVPLAFAAMLVAQAVASRPGWRPVAAASAACGILAAASLRAGLDYRSDASLWAREVAAEPTCREGQFYLGEVARQARSWEEAADRYEKAVADTPGVLSFVDRLAALQNLGAVRLEQRRFSDAAIVFRSALAEAQGERRRELTHNLAAALLQAGDPSEAARLLEAEVARPDAFPASILVRAHALRRLGREEEAAALFRRLGTGGERRPGR